MSKLLNDNNIEPGYSVRSGTYVPDKARDNYHVLNTFGSAVGSASGQWWIPFALKGAEMLYDNWQTNKNNRLADRRQRELNSYNSAEAAAARDAQFALMDKQSRLNSVQSQVHQLRSAGLNPALATGQISPGTVSAAGAAQASASVPVPPEQKQRGNFSEIAQNSMLAAQIENLQSSSALNRSNIQTAEIERRTLDERFQTEIAKQLQEIARLKTSAALDESQKKQIDELLDLLKSQYKSQIDLNVATTAKTESEVPLAEQNIKESESRIDLNKSTIQTQKTEQKLNKSATGLNMFKQLTEQEQAELVRTLQNLNSVNTEKLRFELGLTKSQYDLVKEFCKKHNLSDGWVKGIMYAFDDFAHSSGTNVPKTALDVLESWLDGGNWLHYLASNKFNSVIAQGKKNLDDVNEKTNPEFDKTSDAVKTVPSVESFNKQMKMNSKFMTDVEKSLYRDILKKYPRMTEEQQREFRRDFYYMSKKNKVSIINKWFSISEKL